MPKLDDYLAAKLREKAKEQLQSTYQKVAAGVLEPPVEPAPPEPPKPQS